MSSLKSNVVKPTYFSRPAHEITSAIAWFTGAAIYAYLLKSEYINMPLMHYVAIAMFVIGLHRLLRAWKNWRFKANLVLSRPYMTSLSSVFAKQARSEATFIGKGFEWQPRHAGIMHEIACLPDRSAINPPRWVRWALVASGSRVGGSSLEGARYIHGCEPKDEDLFVSNQSRRNHTLVLGTNGSGKTRFLEMLATQCVARKERPPEEDFVRRTAEAPHETPTRHGPIIVFDPKGDLDLRDRLYATACLFGRDHNFHYFSASDQDTSIRFDPLASYAMHTQVADVIKSVLPSGGDADAFREFAWRAISVITASLEFSEEAVSLVNLRKYVASRLDPLVVACLERHLKDHADQFPGWETTVSTREGRTKTGHGLSDQMARRAWALAGYYSENVQQSRSNQVIDSLLAFFAEDPTHTKKLTSNLLPLLEKLTSGSLGRLLSESDCTTDHQPMINFQKIFDESGIIYFNLESLKDGTVGAALGSILIADLVHCAARRQSVGQSYPPIHVFIDEAAEMMNEPFIQALNKGRSVGLEMTLAAQTISDFEAGLGSRARAMQVLGNVNTLVCLRIQDKDTIDYVSERFGVSTIHQRVRGKMAAKTAPAGRPGTGWSESASVSTQASEIPMVDGMLLTRLPPGEFFAYQSGGRKLKGRVLLMPLEASNRYRPSLGHAESGD